VPKLVTRTRPPERSGEWAGRDKHLDHAFKQGDHAFKQGDHAFKQGIQEQVNHASEEEHQPHLAVRIQLLRTTPGRLQSLPDSL
jgi:hypothetical protein